MPTPFVPVATGQVIEPAHVNRSIEPVNDLEKWREGLLPNLGDQDLGGNALVHLDPGTPQAPSVSFDADSDTGFYSTGADGVGVATGGT